MAFSVEKIETLEQRAEFNSFGFTRPGTKIPSEETRWTVDRERGLFFVNLGGGGLELPYFFRLVAPGGLMILLEGKVDTEGDMRPHGLEVRWRITSLQVRKAEAARVQEFAGWVREALMAHGYLGHPEHTKKVHVTLVAPELI